MPSRAHALLVELFRVRRTLAATLLRHAGVRVPKNLTPEIADSTFPVSIADRHADLVILLRNAHGEPRLAVVVEVQLAIDPDKPRRWRGYHEAAEGRHRCNAVVLVVTPHAAVARWARKPIAIGPHGSFVPLVLGPHGIPRLSALPPLERSPELALLSTLAHSGEATQASLRTLMKALIDADADSASLYHDLLYATFGPAFSRAVEGLMIIEGEPLSDWAKKHYREGKAEGKAEGLVAGEAKGKAEALLAVLAARGLSVSAAGRDSILECSDPTRLDRWIARAVNVESVDALISET